MKHKEIPMNHTLVNIMAFSTLALAGCSTGTTGTTATGPAGQVSLGVDVSALRAASAATASADAGLVVSRVRVLVAHVKVGYIHEQATGPAAEIGPVVVDLTAAELASGAHRDFDLGTLAGGTYGGAEIEIEPLDATADTSDPALADFVSTGASVLVDGTYDGAAFQFAGHFLAEQGTDGDVTVDASTPVSLALTIDPSGWFLDASQAAIDPTDATQHDALAVAICETLDTQPQTSGPGGGAGGAAPEGAGGAPPAGAGGAPPAGGPPGGGPKGGGPGGGGPQAHCVEGSAS
jgi:hypothetical protein